jgi:hypothetical protein
MPTGKTSWYHCKNSAASRAPVALQPQRKGESVKKPRDVAMAPHLLVATSAFWTKPVEIFALSGYLSNRQVSVF